MSKFAALALPVDVPARMTICHPTTGKPLADKDGQVAWLELLSQDSAAAEAHDRRAQEERMAQPVRQKTSPEETDLAICRRLAALTTGWRLLDFEGNPIDVPFSPADAVDLYAGGGPFNWLREQALIFLSSRANFPLRSSKS